MKFKKIAITFTSAITLTAPILAVVACSKDELTRPLTAEEAALKKTLEVYYANAEELKSNLSSEFDTLAVEALASQEFIDFAN